MEETMSRYLDGAVLYPEMDQQTAVTAIQTVIDYRCRTVCIRPCDIDIGAELCRNRNTDVCVVLNFPHGCGLSRVKAFEAQAYLDKGAQEIDMVANYGYIRSGRWDLVEQDIRAVSEITRSGGGLLKVILETSELTSEEIGRATECAIAARADYVKTSTGFAGGGASVEAVQIMLDTARGRIGVKASGGIRDQSLAQAYIDMGVTRLGVGYTSVASLCGGSGAMDSEETGGY
jgi:deoxyribose-phosphate aldolase